MIGILEILRLLYRAGLIKKPGLRSQDIERKYRKGRDTSFLDQEFFLWYKINVAYTHSFRPIYSRYLFKAKSTSTWITGTSKVPLLMGQ